jgi:outer membrane protein
MKKLFISSCMVLLTVLSIAQVNKFTLQQCVETAITNNLQVKQSGLQSESAEVYYKQAKNNMLPNLFADVNHGINQGRSIDPFTNNYINQQVNYGNYSLSSNTPVFQGLLLQNTAKQNKLAYNASKAEYQQTKDNITLQVILAYLVALSNEDLLTQAINQAIVSRSQVERLEIMNKDGAIPPSQYYDLKGQLANDEITIINNRNSMRSAKLTLSQLMNVEYDSSMQLERLNAEQYATAYEGEVNKIYETALEQLAIIKGTDLRKQSAERGVKAAKGNFYPSLYFNGSLNTNYSSVATESVYLNTTNEVTPNYVVISGINNPVISPTKNYNNPKISYSNQFTNNYNPSINLSLRVPIVNSFRARNQVQLAKIALKNAEYVDQTTRIQLKQNIEQAFLNMNAARERYYATVDQVAAFAESFRAAEVKFNAGAITSVDYLVAKNNLDRANTNLITVRYDYVLRTKILDYYQAKPLW